MYVYLLELAIYALLIAGIFGFGITKKREKKNMVKTILLAAGMLFLHIILDFILYIIRYVLYDINSIYVGLYLFINFMGLFMPFLTVYAISAVTGCKKNIGIILLVALFVMVISGLFAYVAVATYQSAEDSYIIAEVTKEEIDLSGDEKEARVLEIISAVINVVPALCYSVMVLAGKEKNRI